MELVFIQKVVSDSKELPLTLLLNGTYIEGIKLNAPKLMLTFADQDNDIADTYKVKSGSELVVTLGDVGVENGDSFTDTFIVLSQPKKVGDKVLVEALQKDVYKLKQHLNKPVFFVDKSPAQIFSRLNIKKKVNILGVNGRGTFHIHNGGNASQVLELMGRELGAVVFYCRNEFYVISYTHMQRQAKTLLFEYNKPLADYPLFAITTPFPKELIARNVVRDHQMWDENEGVIKSNADAPRQSSVFVGKDRLKTLNKLMLPVMNSQCSGTTILRPAITLEFIFHRFSQEFIINESIPDQQIVIEVKHHQRGFQYVCQLKTGVISE